MEREKSDINKKLVITLGIIGFCVIAYFFVIGPYLNRGEGDPYFIFIEVPVNATVNSTVIHLEDKDIMNVRGLDVKQENGKITTIIFRYSDTVPAIYEWDFYNKYGSRLDDPTIPKKYIEYKGVYYYGTLEIP
jgi:hypothetical protein